MQYRNFLLLYYLSTVHAGEAHHAARHMTPAITTTSLTRRFGSTVAVDELDLTLPAGGVVGIVGPNGSGKSTTIRMLLGLIRPTHGSATVLGHPITDPRAYAAQVGALIEDPVYVAGLSGRRNVEVLAALRGMDAARVDHVLEVVGLTQRQHDLVEEYSLGMKQRLGIAMALLPDPQVLLLDEPTNGLDPAGIKEIRDLLGELARDGRTVCVSSHLLSEIQTICDHLVLLVHGRLHFAGSMDDFLAKGAVGVQIEADVDPARLQSVLDDNHWRHRQTDTRIHIDVAPDDAAAVNEAFHRSGIALRALVPVRETLEELFLRVTGLTPDAVRRDQQEVQR
jgi:ABC-2 type transport system ATP-binding protein